MVKKKWKVMRDQYVRLAKKMSNVQKPGNEDDRSIPKWEHFNRLQFLGDSAVINDNICSAAEVFIYLTCFM